MKIAVSIPDDVFQKAEQLAHVREISRSALYANALSEYVSRHAPDHVTDAMNQACEALGLGIDEFTEAASHQLLKQSEW